MMLLFIEFLKFFFIFQKTPLLIAIEEGNIKMVKMLLKQQNIDINKVTIFFFVFFFYTIS